MIRVVISVVGKRTEHWEGFFAALARRPELEVTVVAADITDHAHERLESLAATVPGFRFEPVPHRLGENVTGHMASVVFRQSAWRRLRGLDADIVHVIGEAAYVATFQTIRFRNRVWPHAPVTLYAAQNVVTRFPAPFPLLERYAYREISLAFPITPAALGVLRAKGYGGPARILPLGVDLNRFHPRSSTPDGAFTVGFVGRLEPHKGVADLVAAADRLGCRLLLVGDGSLRPWLEAQPIARVGRLELVPWVGHAELPALLGRMHALALPSIEIVQRNVLPWIGVPLREQFGRALIEAMACGVPVVGTAVGEIPHVIASAGLVVPPADPTALAVALARVRDEPALARGLAEKGLSHAGLFDWERIADEMYFEWSTLTTTSRLTRAA